MRGAKFHPQPGHMTCGDSLWGPGFGHNGLVAKAKVPCRSAGCTSNVWGTAGLIMNGDNTDEAHAGLYPSSGWSQ
jgi:hypothetical protein